MSTAAERAKEKAARLGGASRAAVERAHVPPPPYEELASVSTPPRPAPRAARTKPVRMTLDLAPALHAQFDDWTVDTFRELGLFPINRADVLRVLVRQLLDDPGTQERVKEALLQEGRR